jgi:ligand-binding sensor domain-containing protein
MEDSDGKLWMSAGGGIYIYDGSKLTHLTKEDGLFSNYVCSTVMDKNGKIWAAHYKGGVSCYDGKNWITYKLFGEFADIDKKFDINKGLAGNLSSQITIGSNEEKFPSKIIVDSLNQIWYAVTGGGLFRFKENKWEMVLSGSDYTSFEMIEDSKGNIWYSEYALAGSKPAAGLFKFDIKEQTWKSIAVVNFRNIFEDRAGNIWGTCPEKKMWGKENICRVSND